MVSIEKILDMYDETNILYRDVKGIIIDFVYQLYKSEHMMKMKGVVLDRIKNNRHGDEYICHFSRTGGSGGVFYIKPPIFNMNNMFICCGKCGNYSDSHIHRLLTSERALCRC